MRKPSLLSVKGAMSMTLSLAAFCIAGVAACGREDSSLYAQDRPAPPLQDYIGRWAVTTDNCVSHPWVFETNRMTAADGTDCDIAKADKTPAGFSLPGICRRPEGELPGRLLLTFADADSVTLTGGFYKQPVTLVRCSAPGAFGPAGP